jgi:hypothetical protein
MEVMRGVVVEPVLRWGGGGGDGFGLVGGSCIVFVSKMKLAGVGVWLLLEEGLTVGFGVFVSGAGGDFGFRRCLFTAVSS